MEQTPQKTILEMRQSLDEMDISPVKKMEIANLLDKIEAKDGFATKELKELDKLITSEEQQIKTQISLAKQARKATDKFIKKTDQIFKDYLRALKGQA